MRTLKDLVENQKWNNMSDQEVIRQYFILNDIEEQGMDIINDLAKSKIKKMKKREERINTWACILPVDYLYENYDLSIAIELHNIALDFLINGEVTGHQLKWAKENLLDIKMPKIYFQPCVKWLKDNGIYFKDNKND